MKNVYPVLATISGDSLIHGVLVIVVVGLVLWLLDYLVQSVPLPPAFQKVARIMILVIGVFVLCNALLTLVGHPLFSF